MFFAGDVGAAKMFTLLLASQIFVTDYFADDLTINQSVPVIQSEDAYSITLKDVLECTTQQFLQLQLKYRTADIYALIFKKYCQ